MPLDVITQDHVIGTFTGTVNGRRRGAGVVGKVYGQPRVVVSLVHGHALWFTRTGGPQWVDLGHMKYVDRSSVVDYFQMILT